MPDPTVRSNIGIRRHAPKNAWFDAVTIDGDPFIGWRNKLTLWLGEEFGLFGATDEGVRVWVYNGDLAGQCRGFQRSSRARD